MARASQKRSYNTYTYLPTADSRSPRATSILPPRSPARTAGPLTLMRRSRLAALRPLEVRPRLLGSGADHAASCRRTFCFVEVACG